MAHLKTQLNFLRLTCLGLVKDNGTGLGIHCCNLRDPEYCSEKGFARRYGFDEGRVVFGDRILKQIQCQQQARRVIRIPPLQHINKLPANRLIRRPTQSTHPATSNLHIFILELLSHGCHQKPHLINHGFLHFGQNLLNLRCHQKLNFLLFKLCLKT